ncbi:MAG: 50S ribosomal protein L10 [Planctomycetes bacterium]|nr:50S ribosomal protein L10 [Planctomycetota bacterium]
MPSFINELLLKDVKAVVEANPSLILIDPAKLKSNEQLKLRKDLNAIGAKMKVGKVNLLRLAVPANVQKLLEGKSQIGLIAAKDMIAAAKIVSDLAKAEKVTVKGGLMEGQVYDQAGVSKLATMPSKDTLRGMLVNVLASPMSRLARVLAAVAEKKQAG